MWKNYCIIIVLFLLTFYSCNNRERIVDQRLLPNNDFRLFQGTPAWDFAKAVEDENEEEIFKLLKENPQLLDYQSQKYGVSLLHLAVVNHKMKSIECLLKVGANVNIRDKEYNETPLNKACYGSYASNKNVKIIKCLIKYGADVNVVGFADSVKMPRSPLMSACFDGFEDAVVLLITNGADVNYIQNSECNALGESLIVNHYKIAYYLLQHGADYSYPVFHIRGNKKENYGKIIRSVYIKEELEKKKINYFTPEREYYYKIVDFLSGKGLEIKESGKRNFDFSTMIKELRK